jgi:23S rRNA pseudouridine955/2504/2580 synthase
MSEKQDLLINQSSSSMMRSDVEFITIAIDTAGQRIDNFLFTYLKDIPKSLIYRLLRSGEIRVNKRRAKPQLRLQHQDIIRLPPLKRTPPSSPTPPSSSLRTLLEHAILYETAHFLVINKPSGLAVHGGSGIQTGLIEALRALRPQAKKLELVHRLDRDTSGCLLISKRNSTLRWLHQQLRDGQIDKHYQALLLGKLQQPQLDVQAPLHKFQQQHGERFVRVNEQMGKPARTVFIPQTLYQDATLVTVHLYTGRTHQIRVHAAHSGYPIAGDDKYGTFSKAHPLHRLGLKRLFLHAHQLRFQPAPDADWLTIQAPMPDELTRILQQLH